MNIFKRIDNLYEQDSFIKLSVLDKILLIISMPFYICFFVIYFIMLFIYIIFDMITGDWVYDND